MIVQFLESEKIREFILTCACGDAVCRWSSTRGAWRGGAGAWPPPWGTSPTRTRPHSWASRPEAPGLQENFQKLHLLDITFIGDVQVKNDGNVADRQPKSKRSKSSNLHTLVLIPKLFMINCQTYVCNVRRPNWYIVDIHVNMHIRVSQKNTFF